MSDAKKATAAAEPQVEIRLRKLDLQTIKLRLEGTSPLIVHAWSAKAKRQMLDKQMRKASKGKDAKDPVADFRDSLYKLREGGYGFPAIGFKAAAVDAANAMELKKTDMRGAFHIPGSELLKLNAPALAEPFTPEDSEYRQAITEEHAAGISMRSDMVRIAMGTADIRFRGQFLAWSVEVPILYNAGVISAEQIVNLFNLAGFAVGVGEHRPQKDGSNGMFRVA